MNYKTKMEHVGQPCRDCGTQVTERRHKADWKPKANQPYYFERWLVCPNCRKTFMVESAKVIIKVEQRPERTYRGNRREAETYVLWDADTMKE